MRALASCCLGVALALIASVAAAQPASKMPRIGVLSNNSPGEPSPADGLRDGLRELGWVEGRTIAIEWRYSGGDPARFPALAADLVRVGVDVIVASNKPPTEAARQATATIPIVSVLASNPVANVSRPEGNVTGLTSESAALSGKRLQLLKEALPGRTRMALMWDPAEGGSVFVFARTQDAARELGVSLEAREIGNPSDVEPALAALAGAGVEAVVVEGNAAAFVARTPLASAAIEHRLPTMCSTRTYASAGCLMSYGADFTERYHRAAYFVDRLLKGAKPADLPVEQPTRFELVINLKTARALALEIPTAVILRADAVIE